MLKISSIFLKELVQCTDSETIMAVIIILMNMIIYNEIIMKILEKYILSDNSIVKFTFLIKKGVEK